ncbi:flagellar hook protein FlgE [Terracidiphilus gabretensis]|uniref:flagellar hook protein FlgE n=1 Tax=Terracidiphilus gabretensis TaxID=1577687 RepID=UPI00071B9F63|nr:flagellar hook-basal body complex protein [Terracidiphilus gabretensis]
MPSFYIPLTGLNADNTALNTIANDLANMNTTGFKNQTANFSDLFYQQLGSTAGGDPIQAGAGTQVSNIETDFSAGTPNTTGLDTDVALQGNGFFVVQNGGEQFLTRDGNFSLNSSGQLVTSNGLNVMGYAATNGVVNSNGALSDITIPVGQTEAPSATNTIGMTATLDSETAVGGSFSAPITVYDSLGNSYQASVNYTKTATNQWSYSVSVPDKLTANTSTAAGVTTVNYNFGSSGGTLATVDPGSNMTITALNTSGISTTITAPTITPGESVSDYATALQGALTAANITGVTATSSPTGQLSISGANVSVTGSVIQDPIATNNTGTLNFDSNGNLVSPSANVSGISFAGLSDGSSSMNFTWDLFNANGTGTISQVDQTSAVSNTALTNGYAAGDYTGFTIGSDGTVTASFSNGQNLNVGQIALGNVANLQGLSANGNGDYSTTQASGTATVGVSGSAGLGTMEDGALEASNVNISAEFSDLIIAQRAFEANSKAITTFDTITQETIQMIH